MANTYNAKLLYNWTVALFFHSKLPNAQVFFAKLTMKKYFWRYTLNDIGILFFKTYPALCVPLLEMLNFLRCFRAKMNKIAFCWLQCVILSLEHRLDFFNLEFVIGIATRGFWTLLDGSGSHYLLLNDLVVLKNKQTTKENIA